MTACRGPSRASSLCIDVIRFSRFRHGIYSTFAIDCHDQVVNGMIFPGSRRCTQHTRRRFSVSDIDTPFGPGVNHLKPRPLQRALCPIRSSPPPRNSNRGTAALRGEPERPVSASKRTPSLWNALSKAPFRTKSSGAPDCKTPSDGKR